MRIVSHHRNIHTARYYDQMINMRVKSKHRKLSTIFQSTFNHKWWTLWPQHNCNSKKYITRIKKKCSALTLLCVCVGWIEYEYNRNWREKAGISLLRSAFGREMLCLFKKKIAFWAVLENFKLSTFRVAFFCLFFYSSLSDPVHIDAIVVVVVVIIADITQVNFPIIQTKETHNLHSIYSYITEFMKEYFSIFRLFCSDNDHVWKKCVHLLRRVTLDAFGPVGVYCVCVNIRFSVWQGKQASVSFFFLGIQYSHFNSSALNFVANKDTKSKDKYWTSATDY